MFQIICFGLILTFPADFAMLATVNRENQTKLFVGDKMKMDGKFERKTIAKEKLCGLRWGGDEVPRGKG